MERGIDVARWQGVISWDKVRDDDVHFAILKVTNKNNQPEEMFERNYSEASREKLPLGVYHYVYAKTVAQAKREARAIVKIIKGKKITCGVWLDMEDASLQKLRSRRLERIIEAQAGILKKAGYKTGIYCNKEWYDNVLDGKKLSRKYPFWIARYPISDHGEYMEDSQLNPRSYAKMWQYSSKGKVEGIKGNVDLDMAFVNLQELMRYEKPTAPDIRYKKGEVYTLKTDLKVRTGPGVKYRQKRRNQLTAEGKKHSYPQTMAVMKKGTRVTCKAVKYISGREIWMKTPSGWMAAVYDGKVYISK
ncbi:Lysozyme M1 precursor [uncultured Roseburia sp.]|uniref:GH25 family lysozyme n=1 Tax=Brotonthovivens ammoniilytica TaxID=2981725 RepID=A0ABT2TM96_9FIRM|nr:GH25 family lysozyme [Brotonthovivens ammoniilytica]MCU6763281.1 GH25 family lysozyme [Brotonthovivens ammoniilytica]SCJ11927.1 Lysozyme M1 precursor [uncultured Roseburia sp.]